MNSTTTPGQQDFRREGITGEQVRRDPAGNPVVTSNVGAFPHSHEVKRETTIPPRDASRQDFIPPGQAIKREVNTVRDDVNAATAGLRERADRAAAEEAHNPASLSTDPTKRVPRNKPQVKPPFSDVPLGKFLLYIVLGLGLLSMYYVWKFQRFANEVGGYWNAVTGARSTDIAAHAADKAASSIASATSSYKVDKSSATGGSKPASAQKHASKNKGAKANEPKRGSKEDIQAQVVRLADTLGVKPADLSNAIRHLIDPTAPQPGVVTAEQQAQQAKAAAEASAAAAASDEPGILELMGEALLD